MVRERNALCMTYEVIENRYFYNEEVRVSYGIAVYSNVLTDGMVIIDAVYDITSNKAKIFELVEKCNQNRLSLFHLFDVIEDFFVD